MQPQNTHLMKKIISAACISIVLHACGDQKTETAPEAKQEVKQEISKTDTGHAGHGHEAIVLNNGEKWKVADSMMLYIRTMEKAVTGFQPGADADYKKLAKLIDDNIEGLTENCTMKGPAHDELHKWLVPFIELSESFDEAKTVSEQQKIVEQFKQSFVAFNKYFQ